MTLRVAKVLVSRVLVTVQFTTRSIRVGPWNAPRMEYAWKPGLTVLQALCTAIAAVQPP